MVHGFIIMLLYLGAGFILHANIYHRPTVQFQRGATGTNPRQFILFILFWAVILTNRSLFNRWERLSYHDRRTPADTRRPVLSPGLQTFGLITLLLLVVVGILSHRGSLGLIHTPGPQPDLSRTPPAGERSEQTPAGFIPGPAGANKDPAEGTGPSTAAEARIPCRDFLVLPQKMLLEEELIFKALHDWSKAWEKMDADRYLSFYAPDFTPKNGLNREAWEKQRRRNLQKKHISIQLLDITPRFVSCTAAETEFKQIYNSDNYQDFSRKLVLLEKNGRNWLIKRELTE